MEYTLSLKPQINPIFNNISKTTSTKLPYFSIHYSRAQKRASMISSSTNRSTNIVRPASSPANNEDGGVAAAARAVGGSLAMACAVGAFSCGFALISPCKAAAAPNFWARTMSSSSSSSSQYPEEMRSSSSTTDALRTFLEMMVYLASPAATSLPRARINLNEDVDKLKREALGQIKKSKKVNVALEQLEKKHKFLKNDSPEEKYFVEMALVEILISQGDYRKALQQYGDFLEGNNGPPSDIRPSLYKAIIYTMLDIKKKNQSPEQCWANLFQSGEEMIPNP